jgi:hypothetical protein
MSATSDVSVFKCALPRRVRSSYRWSPCNGAVSAMSAAVISPVIPPLLPRDSDRVAAAIFGRLLACRQQPVGYRKSAIHAEQRLYAARSYSLICPPRTGRRVMR